MVVWALKKEFESSNNHLLYLLKHGGSFVDLVACHPESRLGWRLDVTYVHCTLDLAAHPYHAEKFCKNLARSCEILRQRTAPQMQPILHVFFDHAHRLGQQHCSLAFAPMTEAVTTQMLPSPMDSSKRKASCRPDVNAVEFVSGYLHAGSVVCSLPSPMFFNKASPSSGNPQPTVSTASSDAALGNKAASNIRSGTVIVFDCGSGSTWQHLRRWLSDEGASHIVVVRACKEAAACTAGMKTPHESWVKNGQLRSRTLIQEVICQPDQPGEVVALFKRLKEDLHFPHVRGIFYSVGEKLDSLLANLTTNSVHDMLRTAAGAWSIHHALGQFGMEVELDFFILFSSISSLFGSISQSLSAAVHASLDALAYYRRHLGLVATSIQWAPWTDGSSGTSAQIVRRWLEKGGVSSVRNPLAAVSAILKNQTVVGPVVACFNADPVIMRELGDFDRESALLYSGSAEDTRGSSAGSVKMRTSPAQSRVIPVSPSMDASGVYRQDELLAILAQLVRREVLEVAACYVVFEGNNLPTDESLVSLGLDSLAAVELRQALQQRFCVNIEPTFLEADATIDTISALLVTQVAACLTGTPSAVPLSFPCLSTAVDDCALVSLALRLPGRCDSLDAFWAALQSDAGHWIPGDSAACDECFRNCAKSREFPAESQSLGTGLYPRPGVCWLSSRDTFDNHFFGLSFTEALAADPCHRLLLETTYEALCKLNMEPQADSSGTPIAVFATSSGSRMQTSLPPSINTSGFQHPQRSDSCLAASFLSYHLSLTGVAVPIDGSDSASLIALALGWEHLRGKDAMCPAVVVAAGSLLPVCPNDTPFSCTSPTSRRFRGRDLYILPGRDTCAVPRGEGIVSVVLQRLPVARENGNSPMAILKGVSLIRMGRGEVPVSPQWSAADARLREKTMTEALKMGKVDPRTVAIWETDRLTGTQPEDASTVASMAAIFGPRDLTQSNSPLVLGNAALHIGHTGETSGLATLAKLVLMLEHGYAAPIPRLQSLHPDVKRGLLPCGFLMFPCKKMDLLAFRQSPDHVYGPNGKRDEKHGRPLVGGISSFGSDRTSGCVIIESSTRRRWHKSDKSDPVDFEGSPAVMQGTVKADCHDSLHMPSTPGSQRKIGGEDRAVWLFCDDVWGLLSVGRGLYCTDRAFASLLEQVEQALGNRLPERLSRLLYPSTAAEFQSAQDALASPHIEALMFFSLQWALARHLWQQEGKPTAVMGLGIGEIAAAAVSGILSLEDALELVELLASETRSCAGRKEPMAWENMNSSSLHESGYGTAGFCGRAQAYERSPVLFGLDATPKSESGALDYSFPGCGRGTCSRGDFETPESHPICHSTDVLQGCSFIKARRVSCPSPIIQHAWEKDAHGNPAKDGEAELMMDQFGFRPEPSKRLGQITTRITLHNATCLYISTVSGRLATDTLIRTAEYWDPLVPKKQRIHRAVETAAHAMKARKLICIGCSAHDGVHLLVGWPSLHPINRSPLRLFSFTGSTPSPQLLVPCESASRSSPRAAVVEPCGADANLGGLTPWWKRLLFRLPPLEGFSSCGAGRLGIPEGRLRAEAPPPDHPVINHLQTAAMHGPKQAGRTLCAASPQKGEENEKGCKDETVNRQQTCSSSYRRRGEPGLPDPAPSLSRSLEASSPKYWPSLEIAVELFIMTGLEQQSKAAVVASSWLLFCDIVAPSQASSSSVLPFDTGHGEPLSRSLKTTAQAAVVCVENVKTQVCSIRIECEQGSKRPREKAACCFVTNAAALGKTEPAVSSLSRIRWLPAVKLPEAWLRTRSAGVWPCKIKVTQAARHLSTKADLQEVYWGKRHILCRIRVPQNPREGGVNCSQLSAALARLVTVSLGVAATCFFRHPESSGRASDTQPRSPVEDDQTIHVNNLWVCPYVPFSECWCVIRHRKNSISLNEGEGGNRGRCDVEIFSENGTAVAVALGFGIRNQAPSTRTMVAGTGRQSSVSRSVRVA
ncbi:putative KR domain domain-containing protein [Neospora caninum Liverpool]|nr:putative KR domain domain-containing protein [Neospora caninum Liverpool]CBZ54662.1 putative KR domain domain-containing protein [Neospora caninum Liverpool]|eukprot:XP_003884692.1 putative KR domain domain-containing protein [Neospora caninum Liverpool]